MIYNSLGGYFELEISTRNELQNGNYLQLNSARNALRYAIKAYSIREIWVPYYTCPVVWQAIQKEGCKIKFYHIDKHFIPVSSFPKNDYILYTNYFGICAKNVKQLALKYKNLIVDNAQAFFMPRYGIASFNSARKFFGVADGAYLSIDRTLNENFETDISYHRMSHLLQRIDMGAQAGYVDFCKNENTLDDEPIKYMSKLTKKIMSGVDFDFVKKRRLQNFEFLHSSFEKLNLLDINLDVDDVPMVYPLLIKQENLRKKLIENKIYVATYWNPQPEDYLEGVFQKFLLPLPIDQRYSNTKLKQILEVLHV